MANSRSNSSAFVLFASAFLLLSAILLLFWSLSSQRFRDSENSLEGTVCLPISAAVTAALCAYCLKKHWGSFGFWLSLTLMGQASALQLIDAGNRLHYQHYRILPDQHYPLLGFLLFQTLAVTIGIFRNRSVITTWLHHNFKVWKFLPLGMVILFSSAAVSERVEFYLMEIIVSSFIQLIQTGTFVLMGLAIPQTLKDSLGSRCEKYLSSNTGLDRFVMISAVWVTLAAALLNYFSYQRHPHITDEVIYLYHAKFFANGSLTLPAPAVPEAFTVNLMELQNGKWYPAPPPGWPAILAIGMLLGIPWLVNPLLAGLNVILTFVVVKKLYELRTARIAIFLLSLSPWYVFLSMSFMTHTSLLTFGLLTGIGILYALEVGKARWGFLAGLSVGWAALIRHLDGLILGVAAALAILCAGNLRKVTRLLTGFGIGTVMFGGIIFFYNNHLTGTPAKFPINFYNEVRYGRNANAYGFGPDRGMGWALDPYRGHKPLDALINANLNGYSINVELFGWSIGSLLPVAVLILSGTLRRSDYRLLAIVALVFTAYFFYYYSGGPDFGARYWFLMIIPLIVLTARCLEFLRQRLSVPHILLIVCILSLGALVNYFPWRAIDKYHHFLGMRPDIRILAKQYHFGRSLVLIRGRSYPDYASAAAYNPLNLQDPVPIYAWDKNPDVRARVLRLYSDRPIWIVDGPSITLQSYKVRAGPLKWTVAETVP